MKERKELRAQKIAGLKSSLSKIPIISKNVDYISFKLEMNKENKSSVVGSPSSTNTKNPEITISSMELGLFDQKYEMGKKIGEGANGLVRICTHRKKQKTFAVKTMMMDEQHILSLKKNFLAVRALQHPNIIKYCALYLDMKKHLSYLVMEYLTLPSLQKFLLDKESLIPLQDLKWIFYQLAKTLQYLHEQKICHRDLKPANIMVDFQKKKIKLIDFGSSRSMIRRKSKVQMWSLAGTPLYRAPEMFGGGGYSERVDTWALGVTLYQMVVGKTPFESIYHSDTINNIRNNEVNFDYQIFCQQKLLKDLLQRLLRKVPNNRLSAKEAVHHLWWQKPITKQQLSKSYYDTLSETEYFIHLPKKKLIDPSLLSMKSDIRSVNGADYHLVELGD